MRTSSGLGFVSPAAQAFSGVPLQTLPEDPPSRCKLSCRLLEVGSISNVVYQEVLTNSCSSQSIGSAPFSIDGNRSMHSSSLVCTTIAAPTHVRGGFRRCDKARDEFYCE